MSVKIVLENAKAQLENQKKREFETSYNMKFEELAPELSEFKRVTQQQYDEAVRALQETRDKAISAKQAEIEDKAKSYANLKSSDIDGMIANLQAMIDKTEG